MTIGVRRFLITVMLTIATGGVWVGPAAATLDVATTAVSLASVVPAPVTTTPAAGITHQLTATTTIYTQPASAPAADIAGRLATILRRSTGYPLPIVDAPSATPADGISLLLSGAPTVVGNEGYQLDITAAAIVVRANEPAGLFAGVQTLRQLLPVPGAQRIASVHIRDRPRFAWRGAMLDVARHFRSIRDVKRFVDLMALYKLNRLHLHLSDDQGWRIAVDGWPRLATHGGSTEVGGGKGG